jgi:hypothetical protein
MGWSVTRQSIDGNDSWQWKLVIAYAPHLHSITAMAVGPGGLLMTGSHDEIIRSVGWMDDMFGWMDGWISYSFSCFPCPCLPFAYLAFPSLPYYPHSLPLLIPFLPISALLSQSLC